MESYLIDLGKMKYSEAHQFQMDCLQGLLLDKKRPDIFLVVEHASVFTLGKRGERASLLVDEEVLKNKGIEVVHTERGGDITYHGPGQIVVYPVVSLRKSKLSVTSYVDMLEGLMISVAADFGVTANRDPRNRGVWVGNNKVGSIGISVRQGVTFHGMAFNVTVDLEPFGWINPCGLTGVGVTSLARESHIGIDFSLVKQRLLETIARVFNRKIVTVEKEIVRREFHAKCTS